MPARILSAVIAFPQERVRPAAPREPGATADVVIFSGVRIERLADGETASPPHAVASTSLRGGGDFF